MLASLMVSLYLNLGDVNDILDGQLGVGDGGEVGLVLAEDVGDPGLYQLLLQVHGPLYARAEQGGKVGADHTKINISYRRQGNRSSLLFLGRKLG